MNSLPTVHDADASPTSSATRAPHVTIVESRAAANDEAAAPPDRAANPLWMIAVAMAILFGGMALATVLT